MNEDDVDAQLAALVEEPFPTRKRGRPRTGWTKAQQYSHEVDELRRAGMSPWNAVKEAAKRNRKSPEHISACRKMVVDELYFSLREDYARENPDE